MMKSLTPLRALLVALAAGVAAHAQTAASLDVTPKANSAKTNSTAASQRQGADRPSDADSQPPASVSTYSRATLPPPGRPGRLARVTDDNRGVRLDTGGTWADLSGRVYNPHMFGARGDVVVLSGNYADSGCSVGARSATLTCTANVFPPGVGFTNADVGKRVMIVNVGAGANIHETTIRAVVSPTSVTLADAAPNIGIHTTALYGTDDTQALQAAINAADAAGGGKVMAPRGGYIFTSLTLRKRVTFEGAGIDNTVLYTNTTGDALVSNWPVNASTGVYLTLQDFTAVALNRVSRGAVFEDVGGTYVKLVRVKLHGAKYGVKFDQTEVSEIDMSEISGQLPSGAGLWIVNGAENTPGAQATFTNRIAVSRTQFNSGPGVTLIADDGGYTHTYFENNYNGGTNQIRIAGCGGCTIIGGEFESAAESNVVSTNTGFAGGGGKGANTNLKIDSAFLVNITGRPAVTFVNGMSVTLINNFVSSTGTAFAGVVNIDHLTAFGNRQNHRGAMFDGDATRYAKYNAGADTDALAVHGLTARGAVTGAAIALDADTTWTKGAGAPPPNACTRPKLGSLYTDKSTGTLFVCEARGGGAAWAAK
jgi:hypothetical protein